MRLVLILMISLSSCLLPPWQKTNPKWFLSSYEESRRAFRNLGNKIGGQHSTYDIHSKSDSDLTIDQVFLPSLKRKNLIVFFSGTHGIEGLAGSAIQRFIMDKLYKSYHDDETAFLFLHAMNPWGFKNHRRTDEKNRDLNRNYSSSSKIFSTKNAGHARLETFLNPQEKSFVSFFSDLNFFKSAAYFNIKNGSRAMRQAILSGQYQFPRGIFFGGKSFAKQKQITEEHIIPIINSYKNVLLIDLHTGFGRRGTLHLFSSPFKDKSIEKLIVDIFKDRDIDFGNEEDFYTINGGFLDFLLSFKKENQNIIPLTFEYGTKNSQTLKGSIESLQTIILENNLYWHGARTKTSQKTIERRFREMFYPSSPKWRHGILNETEAILSMAIPRFKKL